MLAEPSGSDTASREDAFSDPVAAPEELALGEGLAATLEDIAAGPRRGASGARRSSPKEGYGGGRGYRPHHIVIIVITVIIITIPIIIIPITAPKGTMTQLTR